MPRGYYKIPEVVQIAERFRRQLDDRDAIMMKMMAEKWLFLSSDIDEYVQRISREISRLKEPVTQAWLNELSYYKQLEEQARNTTARYVNWAGSYTEQQRINAVRISSSQSMFWLNSRAGEASGYFAGLPEPQIEAIYGLIKQKSPLKDLFESITKDTYNNENVIGKALIEGFVS